MCLLPAAVLRASGLAQRGRRKVRHYVRGRISGRAEGVESIREAGGALDASKEGRDWEARSENNEGPVLGGQGVRTEDGVEGVVGQSSELS